jgi:hypothetical protein
MEGIDERDKGGGGESDRGGCEAGHRCKDVSLGRGEEKVEAVKSENKVEICEDRGVEHRVNGLNFIFHPDISFKEIVVFHRQIFRSFFNDFRPFYIILDYIDYVIWRQILEKKGVGAAEE